MNKVDTIVDRILEYNWKIFLIGVCAGLIGMLLVRSGIRMPQLPSFSIVSPVGTKQVTDSLIELEPKLTKLQNTFSLKRQNSLFPQADASTIPSYIDFASHIVIDFETGDILSEKNMDQELPIASLTKVMTAVVALDLFSSDEVIPVSKKASEIIPTKIGVVPGQALTLRELLQASLMTSANDAVEVIRDGIDEKYGKGVFVAAMNKKAEFLGLTHTHFNNPQGFDATDNYSSTADLAILSHYALSKYPLIAEIAKDDYEKLSQNMLHKQFDLYNWNGLLGVYPQVFGLKIGNTEAAGKTTIVGSEREGKKVLAITLGAPGILERDLWTASLLDEGFETLANLSPIDVTEKQLRAKYASWTYFN